MMKKFKKLLMLLVIPVVTLALGVAMLGHTTLRETPTVHAASPDIWDGSIATSFEGAGGDGRMNNPFQISNGAQLVLMGQYPYNDNIFYYINE